MATDVLTNKMETSLHITTKTSGEERAKKAKENNEDVAILSTFLPPSMCDSAMATKNAAFECALKKDCLLGDAKKTPPGLSYMFTHH